MQNTMMFLRYAKLVATFSPLFINLILFSVDKINTNIGELLSQLGLTLFVAIFFAERTTDGHPHSIMFNISMRIYLGINFLMMAITGVFISERWMQWSPVIGGWIIALLIDFFQKWFRDRITLHCKYMTILRIVLSIVSTFWVNFAFMEKEVFKKYMLIAILSIGISQIWMFQMIIFLQYVVMNVRDYIWERFNMYSYYRLSFLSVIITIIFLGVGIPKNEVLNGRIIIWAIANGIQLQIFFIDICIFHTLPKKIHPCYPALEEVIIVVYPKDNELGMEYCIAEKL